MNDFVSRKVPIFWGGHAKVDFGIAPHYERNVFHTRKVFGLDVGASAGFYKTRQNNDRFYTLSVYPLLPIHIPARTRSPTCISPTRSRARPTSRRSCSMISIPAAISRSRISWGSDGSPGRSRNLNIGVKINHYSNGNIFTQNAGVKIPLTFSLGYAF